MERDIANLHIQVAQTTFFFFFFLYHAIPEYIYINPKYPTVYKKMRMLTLVRISISIFKEVI